MNRRNFLSRLAYGTVATAALVSLPASLVKASPRLAEEGRYWACERMRRIYNDWCAAHPRQWPQARLIVGRDLAEIYEGELVANMRFTSRAHDEPYASYVMFKGVPVIPEGRGYHCRVSAKQRERVQ